MSTILLVRHAQSANNALPEQSRVCDPGLTPLGVRQAQLLAAQLTDYRIRRLYCSPFLRSLETTRPIAESLGSPAIIRSDLFELGGCYSGYLPGQERGEPGMGRSELARRYPDWQLDDRIAESGWWGRPYETDREAAQRAKSVRIWLEQQVMTDRDSLDILVIHADFKRLMLLELLGTAWSESHNRQLGPLANAGVTQLKFTGFHWVLQTYNSVSHLHPSEQTH